MVKKESPKKGDNDKSSDDGKGRSRSGKKNRNRAHQRQTTPKFKGREEKLEGFIFDVGRADLYDRTIKEFRNYISSELKNYDRTLQAFDTGVRAVLPRPLAPVDNTDVE